MSFETYSLSEEQIEKMIKANVWSENCPLHHSELLIVKIEHINFVSEVDSGELVVHNELAEAVTSVFRELLKMRFPIEKVISLEMYNGDDVASMEDNNSSCFNGRRIMNIDRWSSHAYGAAIDINPVQNPYMQLNEKESSIKVYPAEGITHVNRNARKPGMTEEIVELFADHGFSEWGGNWELKPDYHHFQLPWDEIKKLV